MSDYPAWGQLTKPEVTGRIGLAQNEHGTPVTVFVCSSCGCLFSVTGDVDPTTYGTACLSLECDSYDVDRDVDLMFEIEPWRVRRKMHVNENVCDHGVPMIHYCGDCDPEIPVEGEGR